MLSTLSSTAWPRRPSDVVDVAHDAAAVAHLAAGLDQVGGDVQQAATGNDWGSLVALGGKVWREATWAWPGCPGWVVR